MAGIPVPRLPQKTDFIFLRLTNVRRSFAASWPGPRTVFRTDDEPPSPNAGAVGLTFQPRRSPPPVAEVCSNVVVESQNSSGPRKPVLKSPRPGAVGFVCRVRTRDLASRAPYSAPLPSRNAVPHAMPALERRRCKTFAFHPRSTPFLSCGRDSESAKHL